MTRALLEECPACFGSGKVHHSTDGSWGWCPCCSEEVVAAELQDVFWELYSSTFTPEERQEAIDQHCFICNIAAQP